MIFLEQSPLLFPETPTDHTGMPASRNKSYNTGLSSKSFWLFIMAVNPLWQVNLFLRKQKNNYFLI